MGSRKVRHDWASSLHFTSCGLKRMFLTLFAEMCAMEAGILLVNCVKSSKLFLSFTWFISWFSSWIRVYLSDCFMCSWKDCAFCSCQVGCSRNVSEVELLAGVIQVFISLVIFLSIFSISYWEGNDKISTHDCGFTSPSSSVNFCHMCFETLLSGVSHI